MSKFPQLYQNKVQIHLLESAEIKKQTFVECLDSILKAGDLITNTFKLGGKLLLCGNGGSAADCQHLAGEFVSLLNKDFVRPGLPAISLAADSSVLTAFANDFVFEGVFERQVQALGKPKDVLLAISTSGNSKNVIRAVHAAKLVGMNTIALTGKGGGLLKKETEICISIPSTNTQYIQETHLAIEHIICGLVEHQLFVNKESKSNKIYGYK